MLTAITLFTLPTGIFCVWGVGEVSALSEVVGLMGVFGEGPTTCKFLGIEIDSVKGVCRLHMDKVVDLERELKFLLEAKKVRLRKLESVHNASVRA